MSPVCRIFVLVLQKGTMHFLVKEAGLVVRFLMRGVYYTLYSFVKLLLENLRFLISEAGGKV